MQKKTNLTEEEKTLIETLEELACDKRQIMIKTIAKQIEKKNGIKYTGRKIRKLLDDIDWKILDDLGCGFTKRGRLSAGAYLSASPTAIIQAKKLFEAEVHEA
ncbi:hypothetical protein MUO79_10005 [Candidatus Bathyarchaeota archaeon]|nr:hypothetical protein [Candidatus Bathyarchaeota archaeon]